MIELEQILEACQTEETRRAYEYAINEFLNWKKERDLSYSTFKAYRASLVRQKMNAQTINVRLAGIRFYVKELAKESQITIEKANAFCALDNLKIQGRKVGNWLDAGEASAILNLPDISTRTGLRDRAALALMIGAGLRRSEVVRIEVKHFEQRDGKWIIVGIKGKHGRTRNIPIADWIKTIVDAWTEKVSIKEGPIIRVVSWSKKKEWLGGPMDASSLRYIVQRKYGKQIGRNQIAPHDLRRTAARLAYEGGTDMAQIQLMLGHKEQGTTEKYINAKQDLQIAPSDNMKLEIRI